ncbi:MAG: 16S rRNA (uracil(1498)-N(3))-methyltransferase [Candidatus Alcyoniella australis]|nr:16S rRNA (uracil(1498)-N(3))-methyltransferase [Candidatus Alcyoniella australis]
MRRFYLPQIEVVDGKVKITGREHWHMSRVLRLKPGDPLVLFDGSGTDYVCSIENVNVKQTMCSVASRSESTVEPSIAVDLYVGLLKGTKMDQVVQKATELGASAVYPFTSSFTTARLSVERGVQRVERWSRIATEAAKQCGRSQVPRIAAPQNFAEAIRQGSQASLAVIFYEHHRGMSAKQVLRRMGSPSRVAIFVGSEGGFSDDEVKLAKQARVLAVGLGARTLRAETAALAALALVQYELGDLSGSPPVS